MSEARNISTSAGGSNWVDSVHAVVDSRIVCSSVTLVRENSFDLVDFPCVVRDSEQEDYATMWQTTADPFSIHKRPSECITSRGEYSDQLPLQLLPVVLYIVELRDTAGTSMKAAASISKSPLVRDFFARYDAQPEQTRYYIRCQAERILLFYLRQEMEKARDKADKNSCKINKLFVTFPSTWTCWMEKYFVACFDIVWKLEIELIHESEAIVNFITSRSNLCGLRNATTGLIVVDFGVDMLNLSTICLAYRETDPTKFHLVVKGQDVSEHSGVRLHAKLVGARIRGFIDANRQCIPKSDEMKIHNEFMTSYTHNYKAMVIGDAFEICATSSSGVPHQISFDKEDSQKMYDQCFLDAFTSLEKYLDDIRSEDGLENTKVVLVGVGFRNRSIWKEVKKRAENRGLALQDSTSFAIDITQPTCVALGAAFAISNPITIREFMQTASFAIQSTERAPNLDQVIWSRGSSRTARISVLEGCDQRIICSPAPKAGEDNTEKNLFYDFSTLALAGGEYDLRMEFRGNSVIIYCKDTRGQANNGDDEDQFEYKVYSDPGSRVCLRDIDKDSDCGKDDRVEPDLNVPRALRSVTRETLKARILERTKYPDLDSGFPVTPGPSASAVSSRLRKR